jgi:hypothetical protein
VLFVFSHCTNAAIMTTFTVHADVPTGMRTPSTGDAGSDLGESTNYRISRSTNVYVGRLSLDLCKVLRSMPGIHIIFRCHQYLCGHEMGFGCSACLISFPM